MVLPGLKALLEKFNETGRPLSELGDYLSELHEKHMASETTESPHLSVVTNDAKPKDAGDILSEQETLINELKHLHRTLDCLVFNEEDSELVCTLAETMHTKLNALDKLNQNLFPAMGAS